MKNNYIYAALGLLALFLISKNKRDEVNETRDGSEKADSDVPNNENVNPNTLPSVKRDDVLLDFQRNDNIVL